MEFADIFTYESINVSDYSGSILYTGVVLCENGKKGTMLLNVYNGELIFTPEETGCRIHILKLTRKVLHEITSEKYS